MQLDAKALADATAEIVKAHTAPLLARLKALEDRPAPGRGEKGEAGERGGPGAAGRDGVGLGGALIDRSGVLVLTLTDGTARELGPVVGKDGVDGAPGAQGAKGDPGERGEKGLPGERGEPGRQGEKGIDGKDGTGGRDGKDGRDGFTLEDFDCQPVDERTVKLMFTRGGAMHSYELEFPVPIYRGVFKEGEPYRRGDTVTWGGSLWHCDEPTTLKPGENDAPWTLAAKKGRDGKDAKAA